MNTFLDFFLHLDVHLAALVADLGWLSYGFLFAVVFCETGLVFTPFLPGDSLIFVAGTLAAQGMLQIFVLWAVFVVASILGDSVNYWVGTRFGRRLEHSSWVKPEYLEKTRGFYEKYGKKTIVMARFVPVVRTFAPFVAGLGRMDYRVFALYNVVGGFTWSTLFVFGGYFFGQIPWIQDHLESVALGIVVLSMLPPVVEVWKGGKK